MWLLLFIFAVPMTPYLKSHPLFVNTVLTSTTKIMLPVLLLLCFLFFDTLVDTEAGFSPSAKTDGSAAAKATKQRNMYLTLLNIVLLLSNWRQYSLLADRAHLRGLLAQKSKSMRTLQKLAEAVPDDDEHADLHLFTKTHAESGTPRSESSKDK